ncbi:MAG TPA: hypothetical protein VFM31_08245, partial [Nitrososphaeraceae archaeon]|nr:hypothetical protein [Nitrososphaeraceae archaeon]
MHSNDDINNVKNIQYQQKGVKTFVDSLLQTPSGIHQIVVYPNRYEVLKETYFHFIKHSLEEYNELVIFLTHYENVESVKKTLSSFAVTAINNNIENTEKPPIIDINKYILNGSLVIIDSENVFS